MGTTWQVMLPKVDTEQKQRINNKIIAELKHLNQLFSTYQENSEISRFNHFKKNQPFNVHADFIRVIKAAKIIHLQSKQQFDPTLAPIIRLWGFDNELHIHKPTAKEVKKTLQSVGFDKIDIAYKVSQISKLTPLVELNLSAIAKGYAVDQLASLLDEEGIKDYLVEIGGELKAKGYNANHQHWQIAIAKPLENKQQAQHILTLRNQSVATSGDYQNFFTENKQRYSHTFDVKTGYPVTHNLASVTVLHHSAMWADGYATALLALGEKKGIALAKQLGLKAYFIIRQHNGFTSYSTLDNNHDNKH